MKTVKPIKILYLYFRHKNLHAKNMSISLCEKQDRSRIRNGCLDTRGPSSRRLSTSMTIDIILLFLFAQERSSERLSSRQEKSVFL